MAIKQEDRAEDFHPVPAVRRARVAARALGGKVGSPEPHGKEGEHEHGPVTRTEVERHKDGKAHVIAHHEDGHAETHEHANEHEAHQHAEHLMSGGGAGEGMDDKGPNAEQETQEALGGAPAEGEQGEQEEGGEGEEECPHCGGKMEGGKCTQCGYEAKEDEGPREEEGTAGY